MLDKIIADLGNNYNANDDEVLKDIIADISSQALYISNRKTTDGLEFEIKQAVKSLYLLRGTEDVQSLSESGRTATYRDVIQELRTNIISNGKRVIK